MGDRTEQRTKRSAGTSDSTARTEPTAGQVIAARYCLEKPLGAGGMGAIWVARHLTLDTRVAVKFIHTDGSLDKNLRKRFAREAKAAARIKSSHVVTILDHGIDGDLPYIVMELLDGEDLGSRLKRERTLDLNESAEVLYGIVRGLQRVHDAGLVHRDLKPQNIFLAAEGADVVPKVVDFGIAKIRSDEPADDNATEEGVLLGSPYYMSPEQVRAATDVDHRSDLWSLGVILYRMVTGERPFRRAPLSDVLVQICADPIPAASSKAPHLPQGIDAFFERALCRDPDGRFQSARELARAFNAALPPAARPALPSFSSEVSLPGPPSEDDNAERSVAEAITVPMLPIVADDGPTLGTQRGGHTVSSLARRATPNRLWIGAGVLIVAVGLLWLGRASAPSPAELPSGVDVDDGVARSAATGAPPEPSAHSSSDRPTPAASAAVPVAESSASPTVAPGPSASVRAIAIPAFPAAAPTPPPPLPRRKKRRDLGY